MWAFAASCPITFIIMMVLSTVTVTSVFASLSKAFSTWGTKHCESCACRQPNDEDDEDDDASH